MATWQFDCVLVPRRGLALVSSVVGSRRDGTARRWEGVAAGDMRTRLLALGPPEPTWDRETERWGAEDATCVLLTSVDGAVEEVRLRIDLRAAAAAFLAALGAACHAFELVALTEAGEIVDAATGPLMQAAERSPAARFARDGVAALPELAREARAAWEDGDATKAPTSAAPHDKPES